MRKTKTSTLKVSATPATDIKRQRGFLHNATDTFHELLLIFLGVVLIGGGLFAVFEHVNFFDGIWWALVTAFTVGYGDTVPHTAAGRALGVILMSFTVFVMIPLITARIAAKMIVNDDAFTNSEQEDIRATNIRLNQYLDTVEKKKATKK